MSDLELLRRVYDCKASPKTEVKQQDSNLIFSLNDEGLNLTLVARGSTVDTPLLEFLGHLADRCIAPKEAFVELVKEIHTTSVENGFWPDNLPPSDDHIGLKVALIHSELSEYLEAVRTDKSKFDKLEELVDVVIRLLDLVVAVYGEAGVRTFAEEFLHKMNTNSKRPFRHGKKF